MPIPNYTFVTSGGQRRFVHRWQFENNEVIECNKCGSTCMESDAYSKHWSQPITLDNELDSGMETTPTPMPSSSAAPPSGPSTASSFSRLSTLMAHKEVIFRKNIVSFMLCDTKAVSDTRQFLLDAGINVVPRLLSAAAAAYAMSPGHHVGFIGVIVRFYVKIKDEMFMLQTTELAIKHHYDIRESVDMIFAMLLEKLRTFMTCLENDQQEYTIQRMNIKVRRYSNRRHGRQHQILPLQYARKQRLWKEEEEEEDPSSNATTSMRAHDLILVSSWFRKYLLSLTENGGTPPTPPFPCNLYCFQECPNSKELYVVPYHLSTEPTDILSTPSFVIICDIFNNFLELQEIANIRRFLHHSAEDRVVTCTHCEKNFIGPTKLELHKALNCGRDFEILKMDVDFIEIYEKCLKLEECESWSLFGIME